MVAEKLGLSYQRVRQICKDLDIWPVNHVGNQPFYTLEQVKLMAKRNTKPGPKRRVKREG
jgi:hypothetical protein